MSSSVSTSECSFSLDGDSSIDSDDRPITRPIAFQFHGARIPNGNHNSLWDFCNPKPTRISRPTDSEELEEWQVFCDKVDAILTPVNQARCFLFVMMSLYIGLALFFLVGSLIASISDHQSNERPFLFTMFGFSIVLPIVLLLTTTQIVPVRMKKMQKKMKRLFKQEEAARRGARTSASLAGSTCKIQFSHSSEAGYHIAVTIPSPEETIV